MPGPRSFAVLPTLIVALAMCAAAEAAPPPAGGLGAVGCIARPASAPALGCATGHDSQRGISDVVLGPGDAQLYVAGGSNEDMPSSASLTTYARDATTGALSRTACRDRVMGPGCVVDSRLQEPDALALSPSGADLYVADSDFGLLHYRRAPDGTLGFSSCLEWSGGGDPACPNTDGLDSISGVTVSPDGSFVYLAAYGSNAVTVLSRNDSDGKLTFVECWASASSNPDGCAGTSTGGSLNSATDVALAPDGAQLYVSARGGGDVVRFIRNTGSGLLSDPQPFGAGDATEGPQTLLVAPGGEAVYVGLFDGHGLSWLSRGAGAGVPTLLGCLRLTASPSCAASPGVNAVFGLAFSADGGFLYAAARDGGTIASLRRAPDGGLTLVDCAQGAPLPDSGCGRVIGGLGGVQSVDASADGRFVYTGGGDALVTLAPEYAPTCSPLALSVPHEGSIDIQLGCVDRNGQPLSYTLASQPDHGRATLLDAAAGTVRYQPTRGFGGADGFSYAGSDGTNQSAAATVSLTVGPDTRAPRLALLTRRARATRRRIVAFLVRCLPGEPAGCAGVLRARSARKVVIPGARSRARRILPLGARRFRIAESAPRIVRLRLPRRAYALLVAKRRLPAILSARAVDPAGNVGRISRRVLILAPKPRAGTRR